VVAPPDHGTRIVYLGSNKGCIPPYTNLTLGFKTDEPATCKVDVERKNNFSELGFYMDEGGSFVYNHSLFLPSSAFPSASAMNDSGISIDGDKDYFFYFICKDFNGNENRGNFVMQFCTDMGPDETAPYIKGTNYLQESYIMYNQSSAYLEVYTDEPATCRWDYRDVEYDDMNNNMEWCSSDASDFLNPDTLVYGCKGILNGLKSEKTNIYYIKCKDQPWLEGTDEAHKRNANRESYILALTGTYPLVIDQLTVNNQPNNSVIMDSTDVVEVELDVVTSGGVNGEGESRCQYGLNGTYYDFYNGGNFNYSYINTQKLYLSDGEYNYPIRCFDIAGNIAESSISFTVERDSSAPKVVRVYHEEGKLKLITDEPADCVYAEFIGCGFNFEDGTPMQNSESNLDHFIDWESDGDIFVKCRDKYGNQPTVENGEYQCTIVVRGSEF